MSELAAVYVGCLTAVILTAWRADLLTLRIIERFRSQWLDHQARTNVRLARLERELFGQAMVPTGDDLQVLEGGRETTPARRPDLRLVRASRTSTSSTSGGE